MVQLAVFVAGLLLIAESQASEEGFLSKYDKFISATVNRGKHGNGPDALAHHNNPAEHGPAVEDPNTPIIAEREEKQAVQKMLADDSSSPFSVSAIGVALFSLVSMIGVGIRKKFQQATVVASTEMPINTASTWHLWRAYRVTQGCGVQGRFRSRRKRE